MRCYRCNAELTDSAFCVECGANVSAYKRILRTANSYYNDGLAKAKVRDLSGAAESLRRSLKYNKNLTDARNLLGLVYYEMGDTVNALAEWVISNSLNETDNPARRYLQSLQGNAAALERAGQAIKKYNLAVNYARSGSEDLAVIQLKKVLSLNHKMLPAYQLLALLYMKRGDYTKAKKTLRRAQQLDTNNTTVLHYIREVERLYREQKGNAENLRSTGTNKDRITYQSGNDTVIQPVSFKESSGFSTVVCVLAGIMIGIFVAWFLILPAQRSALQSEYKQKELELYAQMEELTAAASEEASETPESTETADDNDDAAETADAVSGSETPTEEESEDPNASASPSASADLNEAGLDVDVYGDTASMDIDSSMTVEDYFEEGSTQYDYGNYEEAVTILQKGLALDSTHVMSLYYLGRAYQMQEIYDKAIVVFERIIELYPDSELADDAERFIGQME